MAVLQSADGDLHPRDLPLSAPQWRALRIRQGDVQALLERERGTPRLRDADPAGGITAARQKNRAPRARLAIECGVGGNMCPNPSLDRRVSRTAVVCNADQPKGA